MFLFFIFYIQARLVSLKNISIFTATEESNPIVV